VACLVDTNILVRLAVPADPRHLSARRAVEALTAEDLYVASQNFIELWNVTTRPIEHNATDFRRYEVLGVRAIEPAELS
jgi:predicted nucleic acid-binding protein